MTENQQQTYQQPQQKKSHTVRNVLLVLVLLFVLFVGGCIALLGGVANEVDKAMEEEAKNDKPEVVKVGEAFTHDGYEVDAGWKLAKDFGSPTIEGLRVTNTVEEEFGGGGRTALLTFRFYNGSENLAEVTCNGKELQKGESSSMDCFSADDFPEDFDTVKVSDLW